MKNLTLFLLFFTMQIGQSQSLFINEVMSDNIRIVDKQGENEDWIEIFNASLDIVDLSIYYLTDDFSEPDKWQFPDGTYIVPNGFQLIWADDDAPENNELHCNFKLSKSGENLFLMQKVGGDFVLIDQFQIPALSPNTSYGRTTDGGSDLTIFGAYSPTFSNNDNLAFNDEKVSFSLTPGFYSAGTSLTLSTTNSDAQIYYTTDGKRPNANDILYTGTPLLLDTTVFIRATVVASDFAPSPPVDAFYLVDKNYDIPVVHIGTDSINLWNDYVGIYTTGKRGIHVYCSTDNRNWNQPWKRKSTVTFFEPDGNIAFEKSAEIKISGNCSRAHKMKSLGVSLKDGQTTEYPLFEHLPYTDYRQFKLRNSGNDSESTMLRDGAIQTVLQEQNIDIDLMAYRPVVLYLNGDYFGVYGLREVMNEKYVKRRHGVSEADILSNPWSVYSGIIDGDLDNWEDLSAWVTGADLSTELNYTYFKSQVDIDAFIDYFLVQMYIANTDWPGNNMRIWRNREDLNAKWRWMIFDLDVSSNFDEAWWCSFSHCNTLVHCTEENSTSFSNRAESTEWIRKLLENGDFVNEFVQRHCTFAQSVFAPDFVEKQIDSLANLIRPEVETHIENWINAPEEMGETDWTPGGGSLAAWEEKIDRFKLFFTKRFDPTLIHFGNKFNLWSYFSLQINVEDSQQGKVVLHENKMAVAPDYLGKYHKDIPIRIEAVPTEGYRFVRWVEKESFEPIIYLSAKENQTLTPIFIAEEDYFEPLEKNAGVDMRLFPNPAVDELNYVIGYGRVVEADLTIYDVLGVIVRQEKLEIRRHPKRHILRLDAWQAGIYFFKLSVEGEEIIERVVVQ